MVARPLISFCAAAALTWATLASAAQQQRARLLWVSQPAAGPNSTLLVQGHFPLGRGTDASIQALPHGPVSNVSAANGWESTTALYLRVPAHFPNHSGFRLSVLNTDGSVADSIEVNAPRIKWVQGDSGSSATAGGFLRVFGSALAFGGEAAAATWGRYQQLESELHHALRSHDYPVVTRAAAELAELGTALSAPLQTTLTLTPVAVGGRSSPPAVNLTAVNATNVDAHFVLPPTIAPGEYRVAVRNPAGMRGSMACFVDRARPRASTIHVKAKRAPRYPPLVVDVADYLPDEFPTGGLDMVSGRPQNATLAVRAALAAASAAGGGTVRLPRAHAP